jgi:Nucleotidyl transferase AbiEii toxin, Type IV TA system
LSDLATQLAAANALLSDIGRKYAVVGGLAVSARTEPRFTRDVDIVVSVSDDEQAEQLIREAGALGYRPFMLLEHDVAKRIATVRLQSNSGVLDLLFASSGIEPEVVAAADMLELLPGVTAPVAGVPDLMALKLLARNPATRPQDDIDLQKLRNSQTATRADTQHLCCEHTLPIRNQAWQVGSFFALVVGPLCAFETYAPEATCLRAGAGFACLLCVQHSEGARGGWRFSVPTQYP